MQCGGDMVWRVAVLSARHCSGARPSAAVCRFVSSQVWQIIHPLLSCYLCFPPCAVQILSFLPSFFSLLPLLLSPPPLCGLSTVNWFCSLSDIGSSVTPSEGLRGQFGCFMNHFCVLHSSVNLSMSCNCFRWMLINIFVVNKLPVWMLSCFSALLLCSVLWYLILELHRLVDWQKIDHSIFKQNAKLTFAGCSFSDLRIWSFLLSYMTVNWISLDFGLLIRQSKTFEGITMRQWLIKKTIRFINNENKLVAAQWVFTVWIESLSEDVCIGRFNWYLIFLFRL